MEKKEPRYEFSADKNQLLIKERHISFEEVISAIGSGRLLDIIQHPNAKGYPGQKIYIVNINGYVYAAPFVMKDQRTVFLKTIFPSRKLTRQYLNDQGDTL